MIDENDRRTRHCPMLGHEVTFSYCRTPGGDIPCLKIFDCWWEAFDVTAFMKTNYPPDVISRITEPPKPKISSLLDLIENAKKQADRST
jgi:hypothetical protein